MTSTSTLAGLRVLDLTDHRGILAGRMLALSGIQVLMSPAGGQPVGPYGPYTDYIAPRLALTTLMAALDVRRRTGEGCFLDISQAEAGMQLIAESFAMASVTDHRPQSGGLWQP